MRARISIGTGLSLVGAFVVFTRLVQTVDVRPLGVNGTNIGFAALNCAFHQLLGVHRTLYILTDWMGLVPVFVAAAFGVLGLIQLVRRRSLQKVDADLLVLGAHYLIVAVLYAVFEAFPVNYRPILIDGFQEASYPSSTTLLVLGIMPTLSDQLRRRCKNDALKKAVRLLTAVFSGFMVTGRLLSGVHWLTDIVASMLICGGLFCLYKGFVFIFYREE